MQVQHPRAAHGGHPEDGLRREGRRVAQRELLQLGGGVHLVEHVEVVVGGGSVGPKPHRYPGGQRRRDRCGPRETQLHVALRVVRNAGARGRNAPDVLVREVDRVGQHRPGSERPDRAECFDHSHAGQLPRGRVLGGVLDRVDLEDGVVALGEPEGGLDRVERRGVERVGGDRRDHRGVVLVPLHELRRVRERCFRRGEVGGGEADDVRTGNRADAGVDRRPGHVVAEVVHVGESGRPALEHLDGGQERSPVDVVGRNERGLGREDVVLQPGQERQVVGQTAQQ